MLKYSLRFFFLLISLVVFFGSAPAQEVASCPKSMLEIPDKYDVGSEKYYLAWMLHGEKGQKVLASQMLLDSESKKEIGIAKSLYDCEKSKMLRQALLLMLFDHSPADYVKEVKELFEKYENYSLEIKSFGSWNPEPYAKFLKMGYKQIWFSTRNNSALRLVGNGYQDKQLFEHLLLLAQNPYQYSFRLEVSERLKLFDEIPPFDLGPELELPGESPGVLISLTDAKMDELGRYMKNQTTQLKAIKKWYSEKASEIRWDAENKRYRVGRESK